MKRRRIDLEMTKKARSLRSLQTPAEAKLWARLRNSQVAGLKFRRQHPVGPYVADFYCASHQLIIDIDGETHAGRVDYDVVRTEYMKQQGYKVVRFYNSDVHDNLESVIEAIMIECGMEV